jgi:hypothetical protein
MKVYFGDFMLKSKSKPTQLDELCAAFKRMRVHNLKIKILKCIFGMKYFGTLSE